MSALQRAIAQKARQVEEDKNSAQQLLQRQKEEKARQDEDNNTWQRARWEAARRAMADGTFKPPEIRIPVIITSDGLVSSAKALQQLAEMDSVPKTLDATLIRDHWVSTERPVTICYINYGERAILEKKANIEYDASGKFMVRVEEQKRYAMIVSSLKEDAMLPDPSEVGIMEKVEETEW
ncbi:hypothetical protein C7999DRAFT_12957 [Corynascus novoguineensis]|uniref:Uncharacterized protein n=1 Tax=Corynascus novoguineensis TaxID=1126955 RepID=A0AAN7CVN7_9PEZI|nr:hypothetical protein C7999DRAFT_12957 [Corynascus novoguineensis]